MENRSGLYNSLYNNPAIDNLLDALTYNEFVKNKNITANELYISRDDIRKAIWFASILANSKVEEHIKKIQELAALLFLNYEQYTDIVKSSYVLLSRTGNLLATKFFSTIFNDEIDLKNKKFIIDYDYILELELSKVREDSIIDLDQKSYLTTKFQQKLWEKLNERSNISISAPTSSGKSFIIKKYIKKYIQSKNSIRILYIVPSRALINQVSDELKADFGKINIGIKTAFVDSISDQKYDKFIYIFTPERCLKLLEKSWINGFKLDLIFIDEVQNSADESGRGTLLEYVLRELALINPNAQIITAGPNITGSNELYYRLFGLENTEIETSVSPVFQIKSTVIVEQDKVHIEIKNRNNRSTVINLENSDEIAKNFKKSYGDGLPDLIKILGNNGQNVIYSPRTDLAEQWALKLIKTIDIIENLDNDIVELIDFLTEEIHPRYYLIECLQRGVAFHHGKLPDIIRKEIEDLFLNGKISNLFCTSTLIEGVNLPANNLFIVSPRKREKYLTAFEFGNLIGRAGRIRNSLYGTIFSIHNDSDNWSDEFYSNLYSQDIITVSEKVLLNYENFIRKLDRPVSEITESKEQNTIIFLRHKLIRSEVEFRNYLLLKKATPFQIESMFVVLRSITNDISLSSEILRLNPTIDPVLQDVLYNEIKKSGIKNWVINVNSNFYERISSEKNETYPHEYKSLYWQLVSIAEKLDTIFRINDEAFFKQGIRTSIRQMCLYGLTWLESKSYSYLIKESIEFYRDHLNPNKRIANPNDEQINSIINDIIKIHSTLVSYLLFKYFKLLNDIVYPMMNEEEILKYKFSLALPTMLELGTKEPIVMQLISGGISRSVALKIYSVFSKVSAFEELDVFEWLSKQKSLGLKGIYERYLKRINVINTVGNDNILEGL